jgi:1-acylglycerone phosphate reductase
MIVENTSVSSVTPNNMAGVCNMSKAATAMLADTLRLEFAPLSIKVVNLKTGAVKNNFFDESGVSETARGVYSFADARGG